MKKKFDAIDSIKGFMIALFSYFLLTFILSIILMVSSKKLNDLSYITQNLLSMVLELSFLSCLIFVKKDKDLKYALKLDKKPKLIPSLICLCIGIVILFGFLSFNNLFLFLLQKTGYNTSTGESLVAQNIGEFLITILSAAVTPAICEEFLFRGVCYNGLKEKGNKFAIIVSGLMFMIMHMNLTQSIYQFVLGIIFAIVVYITGSLWYSMIMHFFNNAFILVVTYALKSVESGENTEIFKSFFDYILPFLLLGIAIYVVYLLLKKLKTYFPCDNSSNDNNEIISDNLTSYTNFMDKQELNYTSPKRMSFKSSFITCSIIAIIIYIIAVISGFSN